MLGEQFLNAVGLFIVSREKVIFLQKKKLFKNNIGDLRKHFFAC